MARELTEEELYCLENCTTFEQYRVMRLRFESGRCNFCELDLELNFTLYENRHWILWENAFKNERACQTMLVIATKKHLRTLVEISNEAWSSFHDLLTWADQHFDLPGGMLFIRFGDMRLNAGTVTHLHWNLWVPDQSTELKIPVFKDPEKREKNRMRAAVFATEFASNNT